MSKYNHYNDRELERKYSVSILKNNLELTKRSNTIVLAVKPKIIDEVLTEIKEEVKDKLVISLAAKTSLSSLEERLYSSQRIVRVMPTMGYRVGDGQAVYLLNSNCTDYDEKVVTNIFDVNGQAYKVNDEEILEDATIDSCKVGWLAHELKMWQEARGMEDNSRIVNTLLAVAKLAKIGYSFGDISNMVGKDGVSITGKGRELAQGLTKIYKKQIDLLK
jgi:pyrroline-5-carboxylate reductase